MPSQLFRQQGFTLDCCKLAGYRFFWDTLHKFRLLQKREASRDNPEFTKIALKILAEFRIISVVAAARPPFIQLLGSERLAQWLTPYHVN